MRCRNCEGITYVEISNFYEPDRLIDGKFVTGGRLLGKKFKVNKEYKCITCENIERYNNLPDDQKALVNMYENTFLKKPTKSLNILGELIKLEIDDITIPK